MAAWRRTECQCGRGRWSRTRPRICVQLWARGLLAALDASYLTVRYRPNRLMDLVCSRKSCSHSWPRRPTGLSTAGGSRKPSAPWAKGDRPGRRRAHRRTHLHRRRRPVAGPARRLHCRRLPRRGRMCLNRWLKPPRQSYFELPSRWLLPCRHDQLLECAAAETGSSRYFPAQLLSASHHNSPRHLHRFVSLAGLTRVRFSIWLCAPFHTWLHI